MTSDRDRKHFRVIPTAEPGAKMRPGETIESLSAETSSQSVPRSFSAPPSVPDEAIAECFLSSVSLDSAAEARVDRLATRLIEGVRGKTSRIGGLADLLRDFSLSSAEGLALMVLAEALLRVPDDLTADLLIEDKLRSAHWELHAVEAEPLLVSAAAWALGITAHALEAGKTAHGIVADLARRIGMTTLRAAARHAIQLVGDHFVFGETIEQALARARSFGRGERFSFDMLGEGARTAMDAERYLAGYARAIEAIGAAASSADAPGRPGISVKLSALHPRYEPQSCGRVLGELVPHVVSLAETAKRYDLSLTIDAEEADRLELSLDVFDRVLADPALDGWDGFGLAVQAYQKRATAVIDHVVDRAHHHGRRVKLRLVKGAYWDSEVKRAQVRGLEDYPVFTRKAMTDLGYMACAGALLGRRDIVYPQFATHNALTIASIVEAAGGVEGYEFQRLHGMGEDLYATLRNIHPDAPCRIYAPVGVHENLLAYLVRRLLENGANSSFVAKVFDPRVTMSELLTRPEKIIGTPRAARAATLPLPRDIQGRDRKVAKGIDFGDRRAVATLQGEIARATPSRETGAIVSGRIYDGHARTLVSPIDGLTYGRVAEARPELVDLSLKAARSGFRSWSRLPVETRAAALEHAADGIEAEAPRFLQLLQIEAGKTLDDAVAEWREAIDFCRYYAQEARRRLAGPVSLPGPTGEDNRLACHGRGIFLCISPWNFPLAIFVGQVAAALVAGNSVVAKPAAQTPLIAAEVVHAMHRAGVAAEALHLLPGDGRLGAALVARPEIAGVAFTGSTGTAASINRALAAKNGPIVPLIAETGGINAMIVDATALPEQVADDVLASAFRSAGQRCSALRLLCLQEDVADRMIAMIAGAAAELRVGDPRRLDVHVGPVIDREAKRALERHIETTRASARLHLAASLSVDVPAGGTYVTPHIFELARAGDLTREVFGPILHVVRYKASELEAVLESIEATGFGLTLGIQSRIDSTVNRIIDRRLAGNCYINRNMIGAVVGTQPFGGFGLSGTGPKAGGPHYLDRFLVEQTTTIDTTATGGNASLVSAEY
jgi:RHH-type proline utilization regulon transcriptional repressor/proline dehydrogenase/delta 1-pyrroline-5-carboxylate dehydrogenase